MSAFKPGDVVEVDVGTRARPRWVRALVGRSIDPGQSREREWYAVEKLGATVAMPASAMRAVEPAPDGPYVFDASKLSREERESLLASVATLPGVHLEYARAADEGACAAALRQMLFQLDQGTLAPALHERDSCIAQARAAYAGAKAPYSWAGLDDATLLIVRDALSERARDLNRLMRDGDDVTREDWRGPRDAVEAVERAANDALSVRS